MVNRRALAVFFGLLAVLFLALPAWGHGELAGSDPEDGDRLTDPPKEVSVDLTETPTNAKQLQVLDGCGRNVIERADVKEKSLVATIQSKAQPGAWLVGYRIVSAEDGHVTDGSINFRVIGTPDCSRKTKPSAPAATDDTSTSVNPVFIVLIVVGTVVIVGIALLVRRSSS